MAKKPLHRAPIFRDSRSTVAKVKTQDLHEFVWDRVSEEWLRNKAAAAVLGGSTFISMLLVAVGLAVAVICATACVGNSYSYVSVGHLVPFVGNAPRLDQTLIANPRRDAEHGFSCWSFSCSLAQRFTIYSCTSPQVHTRLTKRMNKGLLPLGERR